MNSDSNNIEEQDHFETENDVEEEDISELEKYNEEQNYENPIQTTNKIGNEREDKNLDENEEPIYVMTLALEQGRSEKIEIYANSDPKELAYNFCRKNNLDFSALDYLKDQIANLLEAYEKQDGAEGEGEGNEEEIKENENENDAENNIEEENIDENDKEGDMNIPEIEEVQETLEMNSNENIKEVNTDSNVNYNNNNEEEEYKINSLEKNNEDNGNDIENNENGNDNNMKIDESNDKSMEHNEEIDENDNFEKEGDCNNEDNENNYSDEIVKEIDFRNIPQRENDIILKKNDKNNQNIQSLPELDNINDNNKENDINENINENAKEINKDEYNKKEKEYDDNKEDENKIEENDNIISNEEKENDIQIENIKNDILESGEKDKNENNNDYEQESINDNYIESSNKKESEYQEKESYNEEKEKRINKIKEDNNYFIEQTETNNNALETKNNTNNNVLLNEQEEPDIGFKQKDEQFILGNNKNYKNKVGLAGIINKNKKTETNKYPSNPKRKDLTKNKFSIAQTSSTPIIINSNSEIYNNNNNIFSKNDFIEGNLNPNNNIFKTTTDYDRINSEYTPHNVINKNLLGLNEKINSNAKRNSYSYLDNNHNIKKIGKKEMLSQNEGRRSVQSHKEYLFERNKKFKQEKEKEILSIQRQVDKLDSKKSLLKENIDINNLYGMNKYSNFNNIESSNHFRKEQFNNHIYTPSNYYNIGKVNRLMEEYNKKYSFHPIINDNYKTDLTFDERLNIFNNISKQKKEELKNNLLNIKVDENGQEYFKPKLISRQYYTNNSKRNNNSIKYEDENEKKMDIFNKNYLYWKKYNSNKEKLYNKFYNNINEPHFFSKVQSKKYLNEANYKAFSNLFNELDSDQDNLITSLSMNLSNIPNNILKIIEPLLVELKEDQQTLNQEEFIKAMSKLFENISSTERRQLISEYTNTKQRNTNKINLMKNSNKIKSKKNYSLIKRDTDNNLNFNNISNINNSRMSKKSYLYFDDNNFDNNFLSSRPKTPIYNMSQKNNKYNFNLLNKNNKMEKENSKINVNNNTTILAYKHYLKVQKMMENCNYNNFNNRNNNDLYNNKFDDSCFDDKPCYGNQRNYVTYSMTPKSIFLDENKNFSLINDYTYNNYLKNLN